MSDKIELKVADYIYSKFKSYSVDSDIYQAADAFQFELYPSGAFLPKVGMKAELLVNGETEFVGIIDKVARGYDSNGRYFTLSGRDMMGLIVDSYCERFETLKNTNLIKVAEKLLKNVPFSGSIEFDEGAAKRDQAKPFIQIEPGQKVFDVLKDVANSRGLVFYSNARGRLVFRKPRGRGRVRFSIIRKSGEPNHLIIKGESVDDISTRYSKYTVISQEQGGSEDDPAAINDISSLTDTGFPFGIYKPYVEAVSDDNISCKKRAAMLLEQGLALSNIITYKVKGHSLNIYNWTIDELVRVEDDELGINDELLIYSRNFNGTINGQFTDIKLGTPGLVA